VVENLPLQRTPLVPLKGCSRWGEVGFPPALQKLHKKGCQHLMRSYDNDMMENTDNSSDAVGEGSFHPNVQKLHKKAASMTKSGITIMGYDGISIKNPYERMRDVWGTVGFPGL
jgi:hypothetical protein